MPITREKRATVRAAMAANVAAGLLAAVETIADRVAMGLRAPAADAMTSADRVRAERAPVVRLKAGAMIVTVATVVEADALSSSSVIASLRRRW